MKKFFLLSFLIISFNLHTADLEEKESPYENLIKCHSEFKELLANAKIAPNKVISFQSFQSSTGPIVVHYLDNNELKHKSFLKNKNTGIFYDPDDGFEE